MSMEDQTGDQYMMKDPLLNPLVKNDRPRVVPTNLNAIIGLKERWKEAGVENVIKQLSNGHGKISFS